jgi:hypothetical protein
MEYRCTNYCKHSYPVTSIVKDSKYSAHNNNTQYLVIDVALGVHAENLLFLRLAQVQRRVRSIVIGVIGVRRGDHKRRQCRVPSGQPCACACSSGTGCGGCLARACVHVLHRGGHEYHLVDIQ